VARFLLRRASSVPNVYFACFVGVYCGSLWPLAIVFHPQRRAAAAWRRSGRSNWKTVAVIGCFWKSFLQLFSNIEKFKGRAFKNGVFPSFAAVATLGKPSHFMALKAVRPHSRRRLADFHLGKTLSGT